MLRRSPNLIVSLFCGLAAAVVCAIALFLWQLRNEEIKHSYVEAGSVATILSRQVQYSVQTIDLVLEELEKRIAARQIQNPEEFRQHLVDPGEHVFLLNRLGRLPQADAIAFIDNQGQIIASTRGFPAPVQNVSGREYFQRTRDSRPGSIVVGAPDFSLVTREWILFFARRIESANGTFLGIVRVSVRPEYFLREYDAIGSIQGVSSALLRDDGIIYRRSPGDVERKGERVPAGYEWHEIVARGGGNFRSTGMNTQEPRLTAVRLVEHYPLVVNVGISENVALAGWWQQARMMVTVSLIIGLALIALARLLMRRHRQLLESESKLRVQEALLVRKTIELTVANSGFDLAIKHLPQGLSVFDAERRLVIYNTRYAEIYGFNVADIPDGTPFSEIRRMRVAAGFLREGEAPGVDAAVSTDTPETGLSEMIHKASGRIIRINLQLMANGGWVSIHEDISERRKIHAENAYMARHDMLTGIANRVSFRARLDADMTKGNCGCVAVLLIDLDSFKPVNDTWGHAGGDEILKQVARHIQRYAGPSDLAARLGGDEFAIACKFAEEDFSYPLKLAQRLIENSGNLWMIEGHVVPVSLSIGIAFMDSEALKPEQILSRADLALYRAKHEGRNQYQLFDSGMADGEMIRKDLARELAEALDRDELEVHFQPVIDAASLQVRSMEALVRWTHETRGVIVPAELIPLAEEADLINRLGKCVLTHACKTAMQWPDFVKVSVNLSNLQFKRNQLLSTVVKALDTSGLPGPRLELEVTESLLLENAGDNIETLNRLHDLGVSITLDDFGTGHSSLTCLTAFPFDTIKIDGTFIGKMDAHKEALAIVAAAANLSRVFGVSTPERFCSV